MDKALFRAYVKEIVKEQIDESIEKSVRKLLPMLIEEAITEIKGNQRTSITEAVKPKPSRAQLAQMLGLERLGDTIVATGPVMPTPPAGVGADNPAFQAINKDYSQMMKAMGLSK